MVRYEHRSFQLQIPQLQIVLRLIQLQKALRLFIFFWIYIAVGVGAGALVLACVGIILFVCICLCCRGDKVSKKDKDCADVCMCVCLVILVILASPLLIVVLLVGVAFVLVGCSSWLLFFWVVLVVMLVVVAKLLLCVSWLYIEKFISLRFCLFSPWTLFCLVNYYYHMHVDITALHKNVVQTITGVFLELVHVQSGRVQVCLYWCMGRRSIKWHTLAHFDTFTVVCCVCGKACTV